MTSRIVKLAAPAVAAALLLGACTSASPSPTATTTPVQTSTTTTATPTTSATTAATVPVPAAAKQRTEAGAKAFIAHFIGTFNRLAVKPQTGVIGALGTTNCKTCAKFEEEQAYLVKYEQHYISTPARVDSTTEMPGTSPTASPYELVVDITSFGVAIVDKSGKVLRHDKAAHGTYAIDLVWVADSWRINSFKVVA